MEKSPFPHCLRGWSVTLDRNPPHSSPLTGPFLFSHTTLESKNLLANKDLNGYLVQPPPRASKPAEGPVVSLCPIFQPGILRLKDIKCSVSSQVLATRP